MFKISAILFFSSLTMSSISNAEPFCEEWAEYIDAFDMIPAQKKKLPYSMEKANGDLIKGAAKFGDRFLFVPEASESLLKNWPNPSTPAVLKEKLAKYYAEKGDYSKKIKKMYEDKGSADAIQLLEKGALKPQEDKLISLADDVRELVSKTDEKTIKACFGAYQKHSYKRYVQMNQEKNRISHALVVLNNELLNCSTRDSSISGHRYNFKELNKDIVEQIVDVVESKANRVD